MIETVVAVLVVSFVFLVLFRLSQMLAGNVMLEHAAMRVARARTVGFNDFMCRKAARVAVIPVAGKLLWPSQEDGLSRSEELARISIYMGTPNGDVANGVLEYEGWGNLRVDPGNGDSAQLSMSAEWFDLDGEAGIKPGYTLYMNDEGR